MTTVPRAAMFGFGGLEEIPGLMAEPMSALERMKLLRLAASAGGPNAPVIGAGSAGRSMAPPVSAPAKEESPLVSGAKLARSGGVEEAPAVAAAPDTDGWNPSFLEAVKQYMDVERNIEPSEQDKGMALAQAGFGMAASNSPYFGQALGQGALTGLQALQQSKSDRAQLAMRLAVMQNEADYRNRSLDDNKQWRETQADLQNRMLEKQQATEERLAELTEAQIANLNADTARDNQLRLVGPPRPKIAYTPDGNSLGMVNANDPDIKAQAEVGAILWERPKTLTAGEQKSLGALAERRNEFQALGTTFKPEYGGNVFAGEMENWASRNLPWTDSAQGDWWQRYQQQQNIVRNELFGSALTAHEQKQWERAAINPNMKPDQIERNLGRQNELIDRALARKYHSYKAGKYNTAQLEALTGAPNMTAEEANAPYKDEEPAAKEEITDDDIRHTAEIHGVSEAVVRKRLGLPDAAP